MQKNHEGGISCHLPERAVLRVQLPDVDSAVLYQHGEGRRRNHSFCAVDDAELTELAVDFRDCGRRGGDVEIVPRHLFRGN